MNSRLADGSDKIAAFERGMNDEQAAMAFETPGIESFIVEDTFLVSFNIHDGMLIEMIRQRIYDGPGTNADTQAFLESEAETFGCTNVASFGG